MTNDINASVQAGELYQIHIAPEQLRAENLVSRVINLKDSSSAGDQLEFIYQAKKLYADGNPYGLKNNDYDHQLEKYLENSQFANDVRFSAFMQLISGKYIAHAYMLFPILETFPHDLKIQILNSARQWPVSSDEARKAAYSSLWQTFGTADFGKYPERYQAVIDLLNINNSNSQGDTPLEVAIAKKAPLNAVLYLMKHADQSATTMDRAYEIALGSYNIDAALLLLDSGKLTQKIDVKFLHSAVRAPNASQAIQGYLQRQNIDVNSFERGKTALHRAADEFEVANLKVSFSGFQRSIFSYSPKAILRSMRFRSPSMVITGPQPPRSRSLHDSCCRKIGFAKPSIMFPIGLQN